MKDLMMSLQKSSNPANIALLANAIAMQNKMMSTSSSESSSETENEPKQTEKPEDPINIQELTADTLENSLFTEDFLSQEPLEWKPEPIFSWDTFNEFEI